MESIFNCIGTPSQADVSFIKAHIRATMNTTGDKDQPNPRKIVAKITDLAKKARSVVRDIDPQNDLTFFRVRTKKSEVMVAPDNNLFLIVLQATVLKEEQDGN